MEEIKQIAVCGGDRRQSCLAESLHAAGFAVSVWGLNVSSSIPSLPMEDLLKQCDCFILPLPVTIDGKTLFAPQNKEVLLLGSGLAEQLKGKQVFAGMKERLLQADHRWAEVHCLDYSKEESFAIRNAVPTVEGALAIAITSSERTLQGSRCLVTGFGRIGQVLCKSLAALGADVWAAARKPEALSWIRCSGYHPVPLSEVRKDLDYDFIFNTVPAMIFPADSIAKLPPACTAIELASAPWGFDFAAGEALSRAIIKAPALPGRFSPKTAGEIIRDTILTMLEE